MPSFVSCPLLPERTHSLPFTVFAASRPETSPAAQFRSKLQPAPPRRRNSGQVRRFTAPGPKYAISVVTLPVHIPVPWVLQHIFVPLGYSNETPT